MNWVTIDNTKCTNCGICIEECPTFVFKEGEKKPEAVYQQYCISCGHCVAVCPNTAIDNIKAPLTNQTSSKIFPQLKPEEAKHFLRSRRSIRNYKDISIQREMLIQLVDIAHFAPTGSNLQGVSYVIVDNRDIIKKAVEIEIQWIENDPMLSMNLAHFIKLYRENNIDFILHNAPALILTVATKNFARGRENSILSLAYLELYAPSIGLGSCWAGLFERCALIDNSPILNLFNIPENKKITGVVMVGYPKYSYNRLVDRNPLDVTFY